MYSATTCTTVHVGKPGTLRIASRMFIVPWPMRYRIIPHKKKTTDHKNNYQKCAAYSSHILLVFTPQSNISEITIAGVNGFLSFIVTVKILPDLSNIGLLFPDE